MQPMDNIKPLYIPKSKKWKGLTVYCYRCKTNVYDICKKSGKPLSQCKHGENHVFKVYVHVSGTTNQRRTKKLDTRDINEAIIQAVAFENEVKNNILMEQKNKVELVVDGEIKDTVKTNDNPVLEDRNVIDKVESNKPIQNINHNNQPYLLVNALARYIGWLHNEGVPAHRVKERSEEHIKDVERSFKVFVECLKENGYKLSSLHINDVNDEMVGHIFEHLEKLNLANRTFNKHLGYYTSFLKWYAGQYNITVNNYFESVKRKIVNHNPEAITQKEYEALVKVITPENGVKEYESIEKSFRNLYRPWLKDGIRLALETGRRREEIINLKWNDIKENEGFKYIKVEDYKVNHIQKRNTEAEKKYIYIPITESLLKLLNELGYMKHKKSGNYILAPEIENQRSRVMSDTLSRGFTHYYNQLKTGRKLTFKCLRKTYITNLEIFMGTGNTKSITGHSDNQVIEKNYIDKKEMVKAVRGFNVFTTESKRSDTLDKIRSRCGKNEKTQDKTLEI